MWLKLFYAFVALVILVGILIFRPVPIVTEQDAIRVEGVVSNIKVNQGYDIIFNLAGDLTKYYINRGAESINVDSIKLLLMNEKVVFLYPEYWTPLDWNNAIRHISRVTYQEAIVFNELQD